MTFDFLWIDFYFKNRSFGFGIGTLLLENLVRSFISIYWMDGELLIDLFWLRVLTAYPFNRED